MNNFFKLISNTIRHWYIPLIVGLIFTILGIYVFSYPLESYKTLAFIFSASFIVTGLSEAFFSISNRNDLDNWGWTLTFGILSIVVGTLLLLQPEISAATLSFYIGFVILFRSIIGISFAMELKSYGILDWGTLMIIAILGLIFSFILLWNPLFAGMTLVFWTGIVFILTGIFSIYTSFKLKKINSYQKDFSNELRDRYILVQKDIEDVVRNR